jgi:hypothetical protein
METADQTGAAPRRVAPLPPPTAAPGPLFPQSLANRLPAPRRARPPPTALAGSHTYHSPGDDGSYTLIWRTKPAEGGSLSSRCPGSVSERCHQHSAADFEALLKKAEPLSEERIERSLPPAPYPALSPRGYKRVQGAKQLVGIAEVVGAYVKLQPAGRVLMGRCPFHEDRRPSLAVFPLTNTYHCFACGAHGDQISFLKAKEGLGFFAALDRLEKWRRS